MNKPGAQIIASASAVLLDFDGPVCSVFGGLPSCDAAELIANQVQAHDIALIPKNAADPISWFQATVGHDPATVKVLEQLLIEVETAALEVTEPHPSAVALLNTLNSNAIPVVIVTNNGTRPVTDFLTRHKLMHMVVGVAGRVPDQPALLKPSPFLIEQGLSWLPNNARRTPFFIGDSLTDIEAGNAAGVPVVALADKARKWEPMNNAGAYVVIRSLAELS